MKIKQVHGYTSSLLVELSNCGNALRFDGKKPKWQEIKYDNNGEPFVTHYGRKIFCNTILRAEI